MGRIGTSWLWALAGLGAVPVAVARVGQLGDSDTYWQIRTGELIRETGRIPTADPFSWTASGRPWHPNSWAFDVLLGLAYTPGPRLVGVALAGAALIMVVVAAQLLLAARLGAHPAAAGLMVLLATPLTVAWFSVRPQLIDYAAVPVLLVLIDLAVPAQAPGPPVGAKTRTLARHPLPALAGIALLHAAWVNLHASAPLGVALAGVAGAVGFVLFRAPLGQEGHLPGAEATRRAPSWGGAARRPVVRRGRAHFRRLVAFAPAVAATLGVLANPHGFGVISQGASVHGASTGLINEWLPIDVTEPWMDLVVVFGLVTVAMAVRRRWWSTAAVLLVLVVLGIAVRRFQPIMAVCAIPVLAAALDTPAARVWAASRRRMLVTGAAVLVVTYVTLAAVAVPHLGRVVFPRAPVLALPAGCRLFNSYDLGGIVILLRPDVPVSLDSRNDLYGRHDVLDADRLVKARVDVNRTLRERGVDCVLVRPSSPLGRHLGRDPGWREVTHHRHGSAYVRGRD